jgi:hypothetical protein
MKSAGSWNENSLREGFDWIFEKNHKMIAHSDFDGIMSSMLLHEVNNWSLIGFYDLKCVWIDEQLSSVNDEKLPEVLKSAIWVDVDVYHEKIRSIGHHILKFRLDDQVPGHINSLNPNLLRKICHKDFNRKYPFGTVHFLMMLLNYTPRENELTELLLWHPNSSLANAQRYSENAEAWLTGFLKINSMIKNLNKINEKSFEQLMKERVYSKLEEIGFSSGRTQIRTMNLKLGGYQCAFNDPTLEISKLEKLVNFISETMGWKRLEIPTKYKKICGNRYNITYKEIRERFGNLDSFLENKKVFSYSIPERGKVNYTVIPAMK